MRQLVDAFLCALFLSVTGRGEPFQRISIRRNRGYRYCSLSALRCGAIKNGHLDEGEVVGGNGRMGSFWLKSTNTVPVSRGVAPGCLSVPGTPIYVATPSQSWRDLFQQTLAERQNDLVWIGNGLPLEEFERATVVVPHYGILRVGEGPVTSPQSPPTFVYGKHSAVARQTLEQQGIGTKELKTWQEIKVVAARKLLWASCMWLLCHAGNDDTPMSLSLVHKDRKPVLDALVEELLPALQELIGGKVDLQETLEYFRNYSLSMPDAIPSKQLAIAEVQERNGVWLELQDKFPQPLHEELLRQIMGGPDTLPIALVSSTVLPKRHKAELADAGLTVWGTELDNNANCCRSCKEALVIGAGIIGSCTALNLARRGIKVTVYDRLSSKHNIGATTPASWAWINANSKTPVEYQWLNQLGMHAWKHDNVLVDVPVWNGALVSYQSAPDFSGGHAVEGPLTKERLSELEPHASFSDAGPVYYFPQDGCVDPVAAVKALHQAARDLGVEFVTDQEIVNLERDVQDGVTGIVSKCVVSNAMSTVKADVVVVAAGVGSSSPVLGGLPLLHRPGQLAFARPTTSSSPRLERILVDTVRKSHILQRPDGTVVVGGGDLEVGGSSTAQSSMLAADSTMLKGAALLAPPVMNGTTFTHLANAVRPIPQDGLPAIGYLQPGLYVIVSHSGVTLAPLLGALAAAEIKESMSFDVLELFRPSRFFKS